MDSKALINRIAFLVVGFSLLNIVFGVIFVGGRGLSGNIVGLVINIVLAVFLMAGHGWARWVLAIRCGFGAIASFAAWSGLAQVGFGFYSIIRLWLLAAVLFSAAIGAYLVLSRRVNEHFNPSSGF